MTSFAAIEITIYAFLLILLFLVCDNSYTKKCYIPLKTVCSTSFLFILFLNNTFSETLDALILPLFACFAGDILMALYNTNQAKRVFIYCAILAFALAHIGFLSLMIGKRGTSLMVFFIPFFICILMAIMYSRLHIHMGKILYPGIVYCYFVSAMMAEAVYCGKVYRTAGLLFFISDFSLIFLYFYHFKKKWQKRLIHYLNLFTYYAAILIFIFEDYLI